MGRPRVSIRALIVVVAVVAFDAAVMRRAVQQGRSAHSVAEYSAVFGLILLVFNLVVFALLMALLKRTGRPKGGLLTMNASPLMMVGVYVAALTFAILSVLLLTSGRI